MKHLVTNIWSEEEALDFYNKVLESCGPNETDFFCIAARKKYMSKEDKNSTNLGGTCMLQKTILKEHSESKFISKLHQADACMDWFTDRDGKYIPRSCMAFYININHTNVLKAVKDFKHQLVDYDYDIGSLTEFSNETKQEMVGKQVKSIQNNLLKSFQDPKNTERKWIDIDCDVEDEVSPEDCHSLKSLFDLKFKKLGIQNTTYIIHTHGGFHILIREEDISAYNKALSLSIKDKKSMREEILNSQKLVSLVESFVGNYKEIKINQNMSIPLPGTIQGGFSVYMV